MYGHTHNGESSNLETPKLKLCMLSCLKVVGLISVDVAIELITCVVCTLKGPMSKPFLEGKPIGEQYLQK
jgi:hypothetical protein